MIELFVIAFFYLSVGIVCVWVAREVGYSGMFGVALTLILLLITLRLAYG